MAMEVADDEGIPSGSESNSEDDNDDAEMENKHLMEFLQALEAIDQNKYNYNDYIQLIDAAFALTDLDKIRQAYDLFASVFPIAPPLWLRRLEIEVKLATEEEQFKQLDELFKKALADYYSTDIAIEYAKFAAKLPDGVNLWNSFLFPYALDYMKGPELFKVWRENVYQPMDESPEKHQALFDFYKQEIELPLFNLDDTFLEFKAYYEKYKDEVECNNWDQIEAVYQRTRKVVQKLLSYEKLLLQIDRSSHQERASAFKDYIDDAREFLDTKILICLFERMATECCLDHSVWLEYLSFLTEVREDVSSHPAPVFQQTPLKLVERALRNCSWSHQLYIEKIRTLELAESPREQVQAVIEEATLVGFQTPEPIVSIWLEYLTYLARNTDFQSDTDRENLRKNFQFCWDTLGRDWGALADVQCKILQYWGKLEYGKLGNAVRGRDLWFTVMESADNATKAVLWTEFAYLELQRGLDPARKIYKRAVSAPNVDDLESLVSSWIQFERSYGSLKQLQDCQDYALPILAGYMAKKQKSSGKKVDKLDKSDQPKSSSQSDSKPGESKPSTQKRKKSTNGNRSSGGGGNGESDETKPSKKLKSDDVEESREALAHVQINQDLHKAGGSGIIDTSKDHITVFMSNLNYDITEDKVRQSFPELNIKAINLIKNATGKTRGYGYVELESEVDVAKAITLDRRPIDSRPVYISRIDREKQIRGKFKYSEEMEPNKLFVKGLPFELSKVDLENMFKQFGALKDVRLVLHKSGKSKGLAYIEFEDAAHAAKAILKLDQQEINGHKISVAISAPPPRKPQAGGSIALLSKPMNLGGAKRAVPVGDAKPRISLIPTSVQKKTQLINKPTKLPSPKKNNPNPKSNEDFRKMLLK